MNNLDDLGNKEVFAKNLAYYLKYYNKNAADICRDLDISASTFSDWLNAKKYPRIDKIEMLANYFNIQKSNLIENKEDSPSPLDELLFSKAKDLSDEDKLVIMNVIDSIKKKIDEEN